jgi:hypothetical protein
MAVTALTFLLIGADVPADLQGDQTRSRGDFQNPIVRIELEPDAVTEP